MSSSNKRQREIARARAARQEARRQAEAARRLRRRQIVAGVVVGALVLSGITWLLIALFGGSDEDSAAVAQPALVEQCTAPNDAQPANLTFTAPKTVVKRGQPVTLVFNTNCGPIAVKTDSAKAPKTVNAMTFLAQSKFFDATSCHRVTTEGLYVLQCGDPTGTGGGGPGFALKDENLPASASGVNYPAGTVAMANAGANTAGSQFFLVYKDTTLPPGYTIWGTVEEGLETVEAIAGAGTADGSTDGQPAQPVKIDSVTVTKN